MKRGEIWWVSLPCPELDSPGDPRPVLVIKDNKFNADWISTAIVAVVTSNVRAVDAPGNVFLDTQESGLSQNSVVNVSQILTLDKSLFTKRVGMLRTETMTAVDEGLRLVLGLSQ